MNPILHDGQEMPIEHLAPMHMTCGCKPIKRDLLIRVIFTKHCYTEAFDAERHTKEQIILFDAPDRARVFCPTRYGLSLGLPDIMANLHTKKVNQTAERRNYVYALPLELDNQLYEIYFMLQRAGAGDRGELIPDLRLTVESAYPVQVPTIVPKRANSIRFSILAYKVLKKEQVRFAAR